eukprot:TRINITY_DN8749_c0_g1_i1.p1 TRINITY_DN8749_c0_g1~~TRINITY_DN8749_c0_g1_i1.p1  ORF type:complete len:368 (+),score=37.19 TRINITY_DN8749_c0_g1_i1:167-1105(+)
MPAAEEAGYHDAVAQSGSSPGQVQRAASAPHEAAAASGDTSLQTTAFEEQAHHNGRNMKGQANCKGMVNEDLGICCKSTCAVCGQLLDCEKLTASSSWPANENYASTFESGHGDLGSGCCERSIRLADKWCDSTDGKPPCLLVRPGVDAQCQPGETPCNFEVSQYSSGSDAGTTECCSVEEVCLVSYLPTHGGVGPVYGTCFPKCEDAMCGAATGNGKCNPAFVAESFPNDSGTWSNESMTNVFDAFESYGSPYCLCAEGLAGPFCSTAATAVPSSAPSTAPTAAPTLAPASVDGPVVTVRRMLRGANFKLN